MEENQMCVADSDIFSTQVRRVEVRGKTYFVHELEWASEAIDFRALGEDGALGLLVNSVRDERGQPVWKQEDIPALRKFSRVRLHELVKAALDVNGFNSEINDEKLPAQTSTQSFN